MKYTAEEALSEILHRSEQIRVRKERRFCRVLSVATGTICVALVLVIAAMTRMETGTADESVYGSLLLTREAGGYVLAAVIAFALGVTVTLLCIYMRKRKQKKDPDGERKEGDT